VQNIAIRALAPERHLSTRTRASALRLYSISPLVVGQGNFSVTKERITDNARKLADVPRSVCEQSGRCEYFGCCLRRPFTDEQSPPGRLPYFAHPVLFPRFHALSRSQRIFTCALEVHANGLMGQGAKSRPTPPYFSTSEPSGRLSLFRKKSGSSKKTVRPLHGVHSTILDNGKPTSSSRSLAGTIAAPLRARALASLAPTESRVQTHPFAASRATVAPMGAYCGSPGRRDRVKPLRASNVEYSNETTGFHHAHRRCGHVAARRLGPAEQIIPRRLSCLCLRQRLNHNHGAPDTACTPRV
jgi:hypothetical protein